jgi:hypothetical protein
MVLLPVPAGPSMVTMIPRLRQSFSGVGIIGDGGDICWLIHSPGLGGLLYQHRALDKRSATVEISSSSVGRWLTSLDPVGMTDVPE